MMKQITTSISIFAFLGFVVVTVVVWQVVLASRVVYDTQTWKKAASDKELTAILKEKLKTYREVSVNAFSKLSVEKGVVVQIVESDRCGVYRSNYDRAQIDIREENGILYISSKLKYREIRVKGINVHTPIFVLMPQELEE